MATFADFALLHAVPSYGGAEVLRAQRILPQGEGPAVHLALLGQDAGVLARVVAMAEAGTLAAHEQVARIHEVGRFEGEGYAVADAVDGVELGAVLEHDRRKKVVPDLAFALAVAHQLAQLAVELQERGDVWAADGGAGLSALFPSGLRLDGVVVRADGKVAVRVLAGAGHDSSRPTPFRAPELRHGRPSASSDVFLVTQVLRALLSCDPSATSAPRLTAGAASLAGLLAAGLAANPDERLGLFMLVERIAGALASAAPRIGAPAVVVAALKREYKALAPDGAPGAPAAIAAAGLRAQLGAVHAAMRVVWPFSPSEERRPTAVHRGFAAEDVDLSSGVERVFADEPDDGATMTLRAPPRASPLIDVAVLTMADELTTQTRAHASPGKLAEAPGETAEGASEPPWLPSSDAGLLEASAAPPPSLSDIEGGPTETRAVFDDDDDATELPTTPKRPRS